MASFKNVMEIRRGIVAKEQRAVQKAQQTAYQVIERCLAQYYADYDPKKYIRTKQLYNALVKSAVRKTGSGFQAEVYFDLSSMDYSYKISPNTGMRVPNTGWSAEATMETAGRAEHGGALVTEGGTGVWADAIAVFEEDLTHEIARQLKASGIPIK